MKVDYEDFVDAIGKRAKYELIKKIVLTTDTSYVDKELLMKICNIRVEVKKDV